MPALRLIATWASCQWNQATGPQTDGQSGEHFGPRRARAATWVTGELLTRLRLRPTRCILLLSPRRYMFD
jgi:hypothetical protein